MTLDEYLQLLESPAIADASNVQSLRDMLHYAPYCASAQLLLLKALYSSGNKDYTKELERSILAAPPESSVYFLLNPKKVVRKTIQKRPTLTSDPTYFELVERMQDVAKRTGVSFEELAKRYLEARQYTKENKQA